LFFFWADLCVSFSWFGMPWSPSHPAPGERPTLLVSAFGCDRAGRRGRPAESPRMLPRPVRRWHGQTGWTSPAGDANRIFSAARALVRSRRHASGA